MIKLQERVCLRTRHFSRCIRFLQMHWSVCWENVLVLRFTCKHTGTAEGQKVSSCPALKRVLIYENCCTWL